MFSLLNPVATVQVWWDYEHWAMIMMIPAAYTDLWGATS